MHNHPAYYHYQHTRKDDKAGEKEVFKVGYVGIPVAGTEWLKNIDKEQGKECREHYHVDSIVFL